MQLKKDMNYFTDFKLNQSIMWTRNPLVASLYSEWYRIFVVYLIKGKFEKSLFFNWLFFFIIQF